MKTNLFKVLAMGIAMLCSSNATFAKQYCSEPLTNGTNTVYLTCQKFSEGNYQILIEGTGLTGLGGSYVNANGVGGYYLNGDHQSVAADGTSITCNISSTTDPTFYTPLYVLIEGVEVNFGQPDDIEWGTCDNVEADTEAPVMGTATLLGTPTYNSAQIQVSDATDNVGVTAYHVVDASNEYNKVLVPAENVLTLSDLKANTTYTLTITAKDAYGNESGNSATVTLTTASLVYYNFPTGHLSDPDFGDASGRILLTIQKENATAISFIIRRATEDAAQPIDFINIIVNGVGQSLGDKTQSVEGEKLRFENLTSLNNMAITVQWHTPALNDGMWSTNEFTVNESELYNAGQSTNTTIEMDTECSVYPNPVADVLNIQAADKIAMATVFNLMGQQILTVSPNTEYLKIDCSALTKGSYMLSLVFANGQKTTYKIVK